MVYAIGIDLGTTFTAAAVAERGREPQMLSLGSSGYSVPSVLFLHEDGSFLAGEAAELRSAGDPTRVARHFKRRLGDEVAIHLAGASFSAERLTAELLNWVVDLATARQGAAPDVVVLTHPANWRGFRTGLLERVADEVTALLPDTEVLLVSEPAAAAMHYVQTERVETGALIGIYDLGGGTFDAAVMRRTAGGFEAVGRPGGLDRLGGIDFDDTIWSFVLDAAEIDLGVDDPDALAGAFDLRANCVAAKRLLSVDTAADIRVSLQAKSRSVRLNRAEFERRIRPGLEQTLDAFAEVLESAGVEAGDLHRILLVGGSSRIPLVSALLTQRFGVPVAVDSDPKNAISLGAAGWGADSLPGAPSEPLAVEHTTVSDARSEPPMPPSGAAWPAPVVPDPAPDTTAPDTTAPDSTAVPDDPVTRPQAQPPLPDLEALGRRHRSAEPPPNPPARPTVDEPEVLAGVATESTLRQHRPKVAARAPQPAVFETVSGQAQPVQRPTLVIVVALLAVVALAVVASLALAR